MKRPCPELRRQHRKCLRWVWDVLCPRTASSSDSLLQRSWTNSKVFAPDGSVIPTTIIADLCPWTTAEGTRTNSREAFAQITDCYLSRQGLILLSELHFCFQPSNVRFGARKRKGVPNRAPQTGSELMMIIIECSVTQSAKNNLEWFHVGERK